MARAHSPRCILLYHSPTVPLSVLGVAISKNGLNVELLGKPFGAFSILHARCAGIECSAWAMHVAVGNDVVQLSLRHRVGDLGTCNLVHNGGSARLILISQDKKDVSMRQAPAGEDSKRVEC
jgi:hypothetical protein